MYMDGFAVGHLALTERSLQWAAVCDEQKEART
jgi:hypothetical protein